MTITLKELSRWMKAREDEHLEFKEARQHFDFEKLVRYCCALANEGGGHMVLGVTDRRPREVAGTAAFSEPGRTKAGVMERLHPRLRVEAQELAHPDGRVLVFTVPSRPVGMPVSVKGAYWMRAGENLVPMSQDQIKVILDEAEPDYSAMVCAGATLSDLDPQAVDTFRHMWSRRSGNAQLKDRPTGQLLEDAELVQDGEVTYAALILLGSHKAMGRHLGHAELVFEYRSSRASIAYQARKEYRRGFLLWHDDLWETINLRNEVFSYQDGLFRGEIPTFNEGAVREAVLNAISHRDYRNAGSVFVRQWPTRLAVVSPGGLPHGITPENILWRQHPRNRRLADALARCGLVERSGQGMDRMFEACVRESKLPPDFSDTDDFQVSLTLHGEVTDPVFLRFLEKVANEARATISTDDLLVLDAVHRGRRVPAPLKHRLAPLREMGVVERVGRKHILSRGFYQFAGKKGEYTRRRGLDRETNKALLLKHVQENQETGSPLRELREVLPALSQSQVQKLLQSLKQEGRIHKLGRTRAARWFPGAEKGDAQ